MKPLENEFTQNSCWICDKAVHEVRKASRIDVGLGLSLIAHDVCLKALEAELTPTQVAIRKQAYIDGWEADGTMPDGRPNWVRKAIPIMQKHYVPDKDSE